MLASMTISDSQNATSGNMIYLLLLLFLFLFIFFVLNLKLLLFLGQPA